ncbi:hypothetical protein PoB_003894300 [Plakobranchus ocellatus]|uniref:Uncharacterized protein n=1 Tax=Plakobranchus ocellatus TaxID=259542 RepID=A0AAV4B020_9GAST|nr:hypothetical protein PoB_003894300 [Plakobranchus ocellatus]
MSGRDSHIHGAKSRKVRTASKAQPRPATPIVLPNPEPRRRDRRTCQDKVATAIRTFRDTARPIQPFPKRHPFEQRTGELCCLRPLPPPGILETDSATVRREKKKRRKEGATVRREKKRSATVRREDEKKIIINNNNKKFNNDHDYGDGK